MDDVVILARSSAAALRSRDLIQNGSEEASELWQSPEFRAANALDCAADEIERLRAVIKLARDQDQGGGGGQIEGGF